MCGLCIHTCITVPVNTIIAWTIDNYHEQGNTIITILLLPLGHISNPPVAAQALLAEEEEDILKPYLTHLTPAEIEAFRVIEIVRTQNKYLTRENILHQEHIIHLQSVIRRLENLLILKDRIASSSPSSSSPPKENRVSGMGTPLGFPQAWGRCPSIVSPHYLITFTYFNLIFCFRWIKV